MTRRDLIELASRVLAWADDAFSVVWDAADRWLADRWWDTLDEGERLELTADERRN